MFRGIQSEDAGHSEFRKIWSDEVVQHGAQVGREGGGKSCPTHDERDVSRLTHEQVWTLADAIDPRHRTLVLLLAYTGLRFGEAAALEVQDLNLLRRQIHVRQQVSEVGGVLIWTPTKGRQARHVPLPSFLVEPLSVECQGRQRADAVFTAPRGGTLRVTTWRRRVWTPTVERLQDGSGFPAATPHDLRHTAASLAVQAGANVKVLQTMLGHKSATLTLDTYTDLFPGDLADIAARFDAAVDALGRAAR